MPLDILINPTEKDKIQFGSLQYYDWCQLALRGHAKGKWLPLIIEKVEFQARRYNLLFNNPRLFKTERFLKCSRIL